MASQSLCEIYGADRVARVEWLLGALRSKPDQDATFHTVNGVEYSTRAFADAIERGDEVGRTFVAVAGLVLFALRDRLREGQPDGRRDPA